MAEYFRLSVATRTTGVEFSLESQKNNMKKKAFVCKDSTGYWIAEARDTGEKIGGLHSTELEAYKAANRAGYLVD